MDVKDRIAGLSPERRALLERELARRKSAPQAPPITRRPPARDACPLSFAQQRLWFIHQLQPESPAYNIPAALRLTGPLDAEALEASLSEIARRHVALRTTFAARDGDPVQVIREASLARLP